MKSIAVATQPGVAAAANAVIVRGNAVDAVCAGVLAASALDASVLFGPLHVLVAGPGLGLRCIDGRLREPGKSAPRPRGFVSDDEVPKSARIAVPALPAAIATALSMFGKSKPAAVASPALDSLDRKHPRRALIAALARGGPSVLAQDPFAEPIIAAAGRMAGGTMTVDDLREVRAPAVACDTSRGVALAPFAIEEARERACHVVCAVDGRGGVAAACYETTMDGVEIDALGIVAPLRADPVMRGKRRTDPGAPLACASGILLAHAEDDRWDIAAGFAEATDALTFADALAAGETLEAALKERAPSMCCAAGRTNAARLQLHAVTLRVCDHADLVDRADVARRQVQRHEAFELGHPNAARLDVQVLPALRLDVRVRDVLRLELAFAGDVAASHGAAEIGRLTRGLSSASAAAPSFRTRSRAKTCMFENASVFRSATSSM